MKTVILLTGRKQNEIGFYQTIKAILEVMSATSAGIEFENDKHCYQMIGSALKLKDCLGGIKDNNLWNSILIKVVALSGSDDEANFIGSCIEQISVSDAKQDGIFIDTESQILHKILSRTKHNFYILQVFDHSLTDEDLVKAYSVKDGVPKLEYCTNCILFIGGQVTTVKLLQ